MTAEQLLEIAQRVAARAEPGEQIEAFVERERETSVRVYEGEIEHLTSAQVEGVGVRVIRDGRVGFAYSGTLDEASLAEVLADARDNVAFGTPDEWAGLATPDGVTPAPVELWRDALDGFATEDKVALAKELERLTLGLDARLRVEDANYADVLGESAVATSTGIAASGRATGCYVSVSTMADDGNETQTGFGFSVGREPAEIVLEKAAADAADRALRMLGATKPSSRKVTVVLDPFVTAQFLGVLSATLNGESVLKGRSLFAHRVGEQVAAPIVTLVDDATNPLAFSATPLDGEGLATRRTSLIDGGVLRGFVHSSYSGRRSGTASTGNATRGGFKSTPGCGCLALSLTPGSRPQRDSHRRHRRRRAHPDGAGPPLGREPGLGRLLHGGVGSAHRRRRAGRPGARVHHRLHDPADAPGRGGGRRRRGVAAHERGRRQPGHPRRHHERGLISRC